MIGDAMLVLGQATSADDNTAWVAFGSALAGGALAGGATLIGSIVVDRRKLTREARARMYDVLVPELRKPRQVSLELEPITALHRAATMAGHRDRKRADALVALWHEREATYKAERASLPSGPGPHGLPQTNVKSRELDEAIVEFGEWLGRRIR